MPKPVCIKCQRFYRPIKNGYVWTEMMPIANGAAPGTKEPSAWQPYKVWRSDLWGCYGCGHEIVVGHAPHAAERHQPHFDEALEASQASVNDC